LKKKFHYYCCVFDRSGSQLNSEFEQKQMSSGISNGTQKNKILLQEHMDAWDVLGKHFLQLQNQS
jgi:hypothetical protein